MLFSLSQSWTFKMAALEFFSKLDWVSIITSLTPSCPTDKTVYFSANLRSKSTKSESWSLIFVRKKIIHSIFLNSPCSNYSIPIQVIKPNQLNPSFTWAWHNSAPATSSFIWQLNPRQLINHSWFLAQLLREHLHKNMVWLNYCIKLLLTYLNLASSMFHYKY